MPKWPHEYLVRGRVDPGLFERTVKHIRSNGYEGRFYQKKITYYEEAGLVYWTMGAPLEETTIINRCRKEDSFESRSKNGHAAPGRSSRLQAVVPIWLNRNGSPGWRSLSATWTPAAGRVLLPRLVEFLLDPLDERPRRDHPHEPAEAENPAPERVVVRHLQRHHHRPVGPILQLLRRVPRALPDGRRRWSDESGAAPSWPGRDGRRASS